MLYGILVQHFANLAGQAPLPIAHLEALTKQLLELTAEVPFYAATVARARLTRLHQRLDSALSDPVSCPTYLALDMLHLLAAEFECLTQHTGPPSPFLEDLTGSPGTCLQPPYLHDHHACPLSGPAVMTLRSAAPPGSGPPQDVGPLKEEAMHHAMFTVGA